MRKALAGAVVLLSLTTTFMLLAAPVHAAEQTVAVRDNLFDPATKSVNVGDTVRWTNSSTVTTHNVTFDAPLSANLGDMAPGGGSGSQSVSPAFTTAGTFTYFCRFHQASGMRGTIVVGGGTGSTLTPTGNARITISPTTAVPGSAITVSGTGFPANTAIDLLVAGAVLGNTTSDANGNFSAPLTIPASAGPPGSYPVIATVRGSNPPNTTPPVNLQITGAGGTTVTTLAPGSVTPTTLATGTALPSAIPPSIGVPPGSSGTTFNSAPGTARTGRNEQLMMVVAAIALAMGTLLVMITPKAGRHARKALKFF
jgi:plastocyanin